MPAVRRTDAAVDTRHHHLPPSAMTGKYAGKHLRCQRWSPPSSLTATACVFDLIETTTPALVVGRKPFVDGSVVRYREALRSEGGVVVVWWWRLRRAHVGVGCCVPFYTIYQTFSSVVDVYGVQQY